MSSYGGEMPNYRYQRKMFILSIGKHIEQAYRIPFADVEKGYLIREKMHQCGKIKKEYLAKLEEFRADGTLNITDFFVLQKEAEKVYDTSWLLLNTQYDEIQSFADSFVWKT